MNAKDTLFYGLVLLALAAVFYAIYIGSTEGYAVTDCQSAYHCKTYNQVECKFFGLQGGQCTFYSYLMYGACGVLSFMGAVMVAVSLYRIIEGPSVSALPPPPPRPGLCPKCGTMNPPTSKYCSECATKLGNLG
jgi:hypothetical protein